MSSAVATILLSNAQLMIERSIAAARALEVACSIAVVDSSGHLLSFIRQDGGDGRVSGACHRQSLYRSDLH
ncbi:heme-binding protein [Rhizobium giardinii]|jgi:uncharacterized protein GlcG (DUF336 family)|uniref:heme-binding protein n=1 Tax=Rhizobium giardinii TaxID=56731 RepID=UPI000DD80696